MGLIASCLASCVGSSLGNCCSSAAGNVCADSGTGREQSVLLLATSVVLALIYQYVLAPSEAVDSGAIDWDAGCDYDDDEMDDKCRGNAGVYRVGCASFLFFTMATMITQSNPDFNRRYWSMKFMGFLGTAVLFIWIPNEPSFDPIFLFISRIGAFLFILMQSVILIDLAYSWNEAWVEKSNEADEVEFGTGDKWLKAILASCISLYIASLAFIVVLYMEFDNCTINNTVLSFTIIFIIMITSIQLSGEEGSLLASGVVSLFCVYLAYSALSKNPDYDCNPALGGRDAVGVTIGIGLTIVTVLWVGFSFTAEDRLTAEGLRTTSSRSLRSHGPTNNSPPPNDNEGEEEEDDDKRQPLISSDSMDRNNNDDDDSEEEVNTEDLESVWKLNFVLALVTCFYTAFLTKWGTVEEKDNDDADDPQAGHANMWIILVSQWFTFALYGWTLVAPKLFPDRDFTN